MAELRTSHEHVHTDERLGRLVSGGLLDQTYFQCTTCGRLAAIVHSALAATPESAEVDHA